MREKIFNHMCKLRAQFIEEGKSTDDEAMYAEKTAGALGIDMDEYEDILFDIATEVASGCF